MWKDLTNVSEHERALIDLTEKCNARTKAFDAVQDAKDAHDRAVKAHEEAWRRSVKFAEVPRNETVVENDVSCSKQSK